MKTMTILDGGMSRELERHGAPFRQPEWSALAIIETPEIVKTVHKAFIEAGSQVITTNSYALVPFHIGEARFHNQGAELITRSALMAKEAVKESGKAVKIAGSIPPIFGSYRADLYQADQINALARPLISGLTPHIDIWLNETQSLLAESLAIKALVNEIDTEHKPYWVSFTLEDSEAIDQPRLRSGETVAEAVTTMIEQQVDAILFNCSQPEVITNAILVAQKLIADSGKDIQIGAYANAFAPQPKNATANEGLDEVRKDLTPDSYLVWAKEWQSLGANVIGGCCGIGTEHIKKLSESLI